MTLTVTQLAFVLSTLTVYRDVTDQIFLRGPKNILIGNVLSMPSTFEWEMYGKWRKNTVRDHDASGLRLCPHSIYLILCVDSDIINVNALGTSIIILNS